MLLREAAERVEDEDLLHEVQHAGENQRDGLHRESHERSRGAGGEVYGAVIVCTRSDSTSTHLTNSCPYY